MILFTGCSGPDDWIPPPGWKSEDKPIAYFSLEDPNCYTWMKDSNVIEPPEFSQVNGAVRIITTHVRSTMKVNVFTGVYPSTGGAPVFGPRSFLGGDTPVCDPSPFRGERERGTHSTYTPPLSGSYLMYIFHDPTISNVP